VLRCLDVLLLLFNFSRTNGTNPAISTQTWLTRSADDRKTHFTWLVRATGSVKGTLTCFAVV